MEARRGQDSGQRNGRRRGARVTAGLTSAAVLGALAFAGAPSASAVPTDPSESLGRFLGGDVVLGNVDLDSIAAVAGAEAAHPSGASPDTNPLAADVLNTLGVDLTDTLQLFGPGGIVQLGAVNQYAAADADGAAAASGAVTDQGAISVGGSEDFPADATLSLTPLVPEALQDSTVSQLDLTLGALSATAQAAPGSDPTGDYQIAGATLDLTSPLVGDVYTQLEDAITPVQSSVDNLVGTLTTAAERTLGLIDASPLTEATTTVDVTAPDLEALLPEGFVGDGAVQVNLETGQVAVDLEQLLAEDPDLPDLNDLPPNYEILSGDVLAAVADAVTATITSIVADVASGVRDAVEATAVSLDVMIGARLAPPGPFTDVLGISLDAPLSAIDDGSASATVDVVGGALLDIVLGVIDTSPDELASDIVNALLTPVGAVFTLVETLETTLDGITGPLATEVVGPVLDVLTGVVSLTGNVQEQPGDLPAHDPSGAPSFTQRALSLRLLSFGTTDDLATVNLASATVRAVAAPTIAADPASIQAGGQTTITGSGFSPDTDVIVQLTDADGAPVGGPVPVTTDASGSFSVPLPVDSGTAAGDYTVTASGDPSGVTPTTPLAVTAAPSIAADPDTVPAGGTTTITGEGFTPDGDVTVQLTDADGSPVGDPVTATAGEDGTITVDLPTTSDTPLGGYTVVATDPSGVTATDDLTVTSAPTLALDPGTVAPAGTATASGTGFTPDSVVTVQLTDAAGLPVGDAVTVTAGPDGSFTTTVPVPEGTDPGAYTVVADDVSGASAEAPLAVVDPSIAADPGTVPAGGTTTVTGEGFTPGGDVTVQLTDADGSPVGDPVTVTADDAGTVTAAVPVPADADPGDHTLVATDPSGVTAETPLMVTDAPAVVATPDTVPAGGTTTITGEGFTPGGDVTVQLTDADGNPVGTPVTVTADDSGAISTPLVVPADTPVDGYTVVATDPTGASATAPLAVTAPLDPVVTTDPDTLPAGGTTGVTGADFTPGEQVTVQLTDPDGNPVGDPVTTEVGDDGTFTVDLPVPAGTTPGDYTVVAVDGADVTADAPLAVTAAPTLTADPETVPAGGTTTVSGEGFFPGDVTVRLVDPDGNPVGDPIATTASADGTISVDVPVPADAEPGAYVVEAQDSTGATAEAPLTVTAAPTIAVDPGTVPAGDSTTVTGEGFTPGEEVTVQLTDPDGDPLGDAVTTTADEDGTISVDLPVPADAAPGDYTVEAEDSTGATAETPLEITEAPAPSDPTISVDPGTAAPGDVVTVTCDGFGDGPVTVQLVGPDGQPVGDPVECVPGEDGTGTVELPVPDDAGPGDYTVVGTGPDDTTAEAPLTVVEAGNGPGERELDAWFTQDEVARGAEQTFHASGFDPGEQVRAVIASEPVDLPVTVADADGVATWTFVVPADFELDMHTGTATSVEVGDSAMATFRVVLADAGLDPEAGDDSGTPGAGPTAPGGGTPTGGTLPRTGAGDLLPLTLLAFVLLAAGSGTLAANRRRITKG